MITHKNNSNIISWKFSNRVPALGRIKERDAVPLGPHYILSFYNFSDANDYSSSADFNDWNISAFSQKVQNSG